MAVQVQARARTRDNLEPGRRAGGTQSLNNCLREGDRQEESRMRPGFGASVTQGVVMPSAKTARHRGARGQVSFENVLRRPRGYVNLDVGEESKLEMDSLGGNGVQVLRGRSRGSTEVEKRVSPTPERRPPMDSGAGGRRQPSSEPSPGWSRKETGRKECQGGGVVNGVKAAESMKIKVTTRMSPRTPLSCTGTVSGGDTPGGSVVKGRRNREAARR